jgi:hypothetical protein
LVKVKKQEKDLEQLLLDELGKIVFGFRSKRLRYPYELVVGNIY